MSRFAYVIASVLLLAPVSAFAKTYSVPSDSPIATVSIPDNWSPNEYDNGVEATSADSGVYVAIEAVAATDAANATKDGFAFFEKQGVTIDQKSVKTQQIKVNGLDAFDISMSGKDKDGPTQVEMTLVITNSAGKFLMLYLWGSEKGQAANATELQAIETSLQATK